ncbi:MAG: hypothetical protein KatS3mg124_0012 [Porticoccaceae bacterium]|nr:MAG: hypothetical protein KatS3mg124_0012 [Porticoccaceae bacterium]
MKTFVEWAAQLPEEVYEGLVRAVELGKWPDGTRLTAEQRALCLQAVIAYDHRHKPPEARIGYLPGGCPGGGEPQASPAPAADE